MAPDEIRDDLVFLHELLVRARDADGDQVLGIFPALTDPELAGVEGRIADFVAERYGIRYGDGRWHVGAIEGEWHAPGWPRAGSPLTNNRFPYLLDISASNYFSAQFWMGDEAPPGFHRVPPGGRVVLEGEFPRARYFGFHPNDIETNNLPTLRDVDIEPAPGSDNPYRGPVAEGRERRFRVEMVFERRPPDPAPNTLYVGETKNGGPNPAVFLIYRTTGSVLGALPPNNTGVDLPAVTIVDAAGRVVEHFPEVDPYPPGYRPPVDTTRFASLPIPDARALMAPEEPTVRSNWGLPYDILASADISYLSIPYTERLGEVFVCRGRAFTTPRTPEEPVWVPGRDIRAFTVATYNFWAGVCNAAVLDTEVAVDDEGWYTIVVSTPENRPATATPERGVTWLDWGPYHDGRLTWRFLVRDEPPLVALREAVESGRPGPDIADHVPVGRHVSRAAFEDGSWRRRFEVRA